MSLTEAVQTTPLRPSKVFCEGYGDFALQSSDGVVFYISSFLLAYASPVFGDMFNLGPRPIQSDQNDARDDIALQPTPPVQLSEDAFTLDLLLRHIDPKQIPAPIGEHVGKLLEVARKYQLGTIMLWFETESMKYVEHPNNPTPGQSLMSYNPLLVLSLATEYDLRNLAQQAACAIIIGEASLLQKNVDIRLDIYRHVCALREARIQWYVERIGVIASKLHRGKPVQPGTCPCSNTRSSWIHKLHEAVLKTPKWSVFAAVVASPTRHCKPGCGDWALQVEEDMMVWSHHALQMESALPILPW